MNLRTLEFTSFATAAAGLIQSGASATAVQKILGHRSAAFTLTVWGHIFDTDLDLVAENLDQAGTVASAWRRTASSPPRRERSWARRVPSG